MQSVGDGAQKGGSCSRGSATDAQKRLGDRIGRRGRCEELGYLFPWLEWPVHSRGMSAGTDNWSKAMSGRKKVCMGRSVWSTRNGVGEGKLPQAVFYRARNKTE